ncbi:glycosyltransferase family 2 protein [Rhizobium tubonense]|uniref:Glycosyl transferase n=1 Tax=Rhizobium tubonense TaxID=484088 RepID=A0A2W4EPZ2_9HYPH|nr:glycosyltransferase family 2 protein [Rhizobium tubonense]PZM15566.1 glycosyl transferase [Rhizobium tubonense]
MLNKMLSNSPIFSVVIPVYNRADLVLNAIKSVLDQSLQDFEILIIDDGSTDDVASSILSVQDQRIRLFRQSNAGASSARNAGIDLASSRYIAFLDSDDLFLPHHLETVKVLLEKSDDVAAYAPVIVRRGSGRAFVKPPRAIRSDEDMAIYLICDRGFVQTSGLALRSETAKRVKYREDAIFGDDTDFAIRLQLAGCRFEMAESPTVVWADDVEHDRLSTGRTPIGDLRWLEDLRPQIPVRAYYGYRGWHFAKSMAQKNAWQAMMLYLAAVLHGAYSPRLAGIVFLQIVLPDRQYRNITDKWLLFLKTWGRKFEAA